MPCSACGHGKNTTFKPNKTFIMGANRKSVQSVNKTQQVSRPQYTIVAIFGLYLLGRR